MIQKRGKPTTARRPPMPMHEGPGKRSLNNDLGWLLEFLNIDASTLPTGGFLKVLSELLIFLYKDEVKSPDAMKRLCVDRDLNRKAVERIQELMKGCLYIILTVNHRSREDGDAAYEVDTVETQHTLLVKANRVSIKPLDRLIPHGMAVSLIPLPARYKPPPLESGVEADQDYIDQHYSKVDHEKYAFFSTCFDPDIGTTILFSLVALLTHFHLDCIRKCPECQKYYRSTRKKQSPLCASCLKKKNTYKWRAKNRETYNEYQRNLAKGINDERPTEIRDRLANEQTERSDGNGR